MATLIRVKNTIINLDHVVRIRIFEPEDGGGVQVLFIDDDEPLVIPDDLVPTFLKEVARYVPQTHDLNDSIEVKILLIRQGLSVAQMAREMGTRRDMVSQLIHGHYDYPRLRREMARRYGIVCPPPREREKVA